MAAFAFATVAQISEAGQCSDVDGPFTSSIEVGPGCVDSPIQMCTHGHLDGDLEGSYEFSFLTPPVQDPTNPARTTFTGKSIITLDHGRQLYGEDSGYLDARPDGLFDFQTTVNIVGGNHEFRNAVGRLVATGLANFATGVTTGSYEGRVCKHAGGGCGAAFDDDD
jgi:hypothetical protein